MVIYFDIQFILWWERIQVNCSKPMGLRAGECNMDNIVIWGDEGQYVVVIFVVVGVDCLESGATYSTVH